MIVAREMPWLVWMGLILEEPAAGQVEKPLVTTPAVSVLGILNTSQQPLLGSFWSCLSLMQTQGLFLSTWKEGEPSTWLCRCMNRPTRPSIGTSFL